MKTVEVHHAFGIDSLTVADRPQPEPGPNDVVVKINSVSLNYRDLASGEVVAVGQKVTQFKKGDRVTTQFIQDWQTGPFEEGYLGETYLATSLGVPGPGTLSEYINLPEHGLVHTPAYLTDDW